MTKEKIKDLIAKMTLEEKAAMCSGADFWHTESCERLGIPASMVSDGPHGLRKQDDKADHLGVNESIKAVCFPAGCGTAASFNRDLLYHMGETLGNECQAEGVSVILGPAVNIKRSPLCGRNFEYYSEDPLVASEIAGSLIRGVQSKHVGTSLKHFLANNQETRRMSVNEIIDERTLNEIYLAAFEGAVKKAKPWTVMCSYNKINGTYTAAHHKYLTETLRDKWGFDGYVMSDWGAVNDRVEDLKAGLDLEMPSSMGVNDQLIVEAVQNGTLEEQVLDTAVERILNIVYRYNENRDTEAVFDLDHDHEVAKKVAEETIVLLKNENVLPLTEGEEIAFIGKYAKKPRYQGGGSSHINSFRVESALEAVKGIAEVTYAQGYEDVEDKVDYALQARAVGVAAEADIAVIFAGLPDNFESEGYDRTHLNLPDCQNRLIEEILEVQKDVIVVLHNGSPVLMPWKDKVKGIIEAYLGGQAVGKATVNVLFGQVNPSGRLAETFPLRLEDTPCYLTYGKGKEKAVYQEGVFVGYRYYCTRNREVLFPFGHGLSYTTFAYSNLKLDKTEMSDAETVTVSVDVKNTGDVAGKEVVQLYVSAGESEIIRPIRELRGFDKISLEPGEEKTVTFTLGKRAFAYWNEEIHDWYVSDGAYEIQIGKNAEEMLLSDTIRVYSTTVIPKVYTMNTCLGELMRDAHAQAVMGPFMEGMAQNTDAGKIEEAQASDPSGAVNQEMMAAMMEEMPLRQLLSFVPGMQVEMLEQLLAALNA